MHDSLTAFRRVEKHFKSRHAQAPEAVKERKKQSRLQVCGDAPRTESISHGDYPMLNGQGVINLSRTTFEERDEAETAGWDVPEDRFGGRQYEEIQVEKTDDFDGGSQSRHVKGYVLGDGLIYIPQYLSPAAQLRLVRSSLEEYTCPPNPLNLSTHYVLPPEFSLFDQYVADPTHLVNSKASVSSQHPTPPPSDRSETISAAAASKQNSVASTRSSRPITPQRELISNKPAYEEGYEALKQKVAQWKGDEPSYKMKSKSVAKLMENELRWANLGWVYNWTNKAYDFTTSDPIPFPSRLAKMCQHIVRGIPWERIFGSEDEESVSQFTTLKPNNWQDWQRDYAPDTGIVNFYHMKDTLMGHVDRSELDPYRPLVSISLGYAAIFLCGGSTRDVPPLPLILRSGDVIVMSGRSRSFYHGVPRIMEGTLPKYFEEDERDDRVMRACKRFIAGARININARQVFPVDFVPPGREQECT